MLSLATGDNFHNDDDLFIDSTKDNESDLPYWKINQKLQLVNGSLAILGTQNLEKPPSEVGER